MPAAKPGSALSWANNVNHAVGNAVDIGQPIKVAPPAGNIAEGSSPGFPFPAQYFDYLINLAGQWTAYLRDFEQNAFTWALGQTWTALGVFNSGVQIAAGSLTATLGNIVVSAGSVTTTLGDIIAAAGNITATAGKMTVGLTKSSATAGAGQAIAVGELYKDSVPIAWGSFHLSAGVLTMYRGLNILSFSRSQAGVYIININNGPANYLVPFAGSNDNGIGPVIVASACAVSTTQVQVNQVALGLGGAGACTIALTDANFEVVMFGG